MLENRKGISNGKSTCPKLPPKCNVNVATKGDKPQVGDGGAAVSAAELPRFPLTVHGEPVGFVDHHDLLVLVHGPSPERFGQHVGVNALQPLAQRRQLPQPPPRRVRGGLGEKGTVIQGIN